MKDMQEIGIERELCHDSRIFGAAVRKIVERLAILHKKKIWQTVVIHFQGFGKKVLNNNVRVLVLRFDLFGNGTCRGIVPHPETAG
jgi:hypothetical protein